MPFVVVHLQGYNLSVSHMYSACICINSLYTGFKL